MTEELYDLFVLNLQLFFLFKFSLNFFLKWAFAKFIYK